MTAPIARYLCAQAHSYKKSHSFTATSASISYCLKPTCWTCSTSWRSLSPKSSVGKTLPRPSAQDRRPIPLSPITQRCTHPAGKYLEPRGHAIEPEQRPQKSDGECFLHPIASSLTVTRCNIRMGLMLGIVCL